MCIQNEHVQGSPFTVQVVQSGGMILKFGRKGSNMGEFNGIFGVAVDPVEGRIIVTDCHNHRVQVFSPDGIFLFHFGRKGEGSGEFQCPTGVAIDVRGQIIVCERLSYRLQVRKWLYKENENLRRNHSTDHLTGHHRGFFFNCQPLN